MPVEYNYTFKRVFLSWELLHLLSYCIFLTRNNGLCNYYHLNSKREITEENLRVAFDKMSNHNLYIAAEDIVDLLGADSNEEEIFNILAENNLKPSSQIYFPEVTFLCIPR